MELLIFALELFAHFVITLIAFGAAMQHWHDRHDKQSHVVDELADLRAMLIELATQIAELKRGKFH